MLLGEPYTRAQRKCKRCSGTGQRVKLTPDLIHHGKLECSQCGVLIRWLRKPKGTKVKAPRHINSERDFMTWCRANNLRAKRDETKTPIVTSRSLSLKGLVMAWNAPDRLCVIQTSWSKKKSQFWRGCTLWRAGRPKILQDADEEFVLEFDARIGVDVAKKLGMIKQEPRGAALVSQSGIWGAKPVSEAPVR